MYFFQLEVLNLGNNVLEDLPEALQECISLTKLHLFGNRIKDLHPDILGSVFNFLVCAKSSFAG